MIVEKLVQIRSLRRIASIALLKTLNTPQILLFRSFNHSQKRFCPDLKTNSKSLMPPKNSKRKVDSSSKNAPTAKDPFEASRRTKKAEKLDNRELIDSSSSSSSLSSKQNIIDNNGNSRSPSPVRKKHKNESENGQREGEKSSRKKKAAADAKSKVDKEHEVEEVKETQVFNSAAAKFDKEEFKKSSNGKEWNFKIVSWNVNGIRAWLEKDGIDYLKAEDPDIFCCQETKCDKSKIPPKAELHNYHCYWLSGDTQGYSGVGLMSKIKPIKVNYGINDKKFDDEGRVIVAEYENFYVINTYIPNSGRGLVRLAFRMEWEKAFLKFLNELEKSKPVIWTGDLNVAHNPIDLKNPDTNTKTAGFTKDERECFTRLLLHGYFDSYRYLYPSRTGAYTFWSYLRSSRASNVGWRLDYFVLSEKLKEKLVDNCIRSQVMGSDHCPIVLYLKI